MKNRFKKVDWSVITPSDWKTLNNVEIARKAGCSYSQVKAYLSKRMLSGSGLARPVIHGGPRRGTGLDWSKITPQDWRAMLNREIAKQVGCSAPTARTRRRWLIAQDQKAGKTGERFVCANARSKPAIDWKPITPEDWRNMPDSEIARKLGCSISSVARRRRNLMKTPSGKQRFSHVKPPRQPGSRHDWEKIERADWKGMKDFQIARKVGCSLSTATLRRKWLILTAVEAGEKSREFICEQPLRKKKPAPDWSLLKPQDWEMYNIEIARKLGCPAYRVSFQRKKMIAEEKKNRRKNRTRR